MNLKITKFGQSAEGIELTGNPKRCEPVHVRVTFPGGDVEITRAVEGDPMTDYWVHVRIDHPKDGMFVPGESQAARFVAARLDQVDKHSADADLGDFESPGLYHVALRVSRL